MLSVAAILAADTLVTEKTAALVTDHVIVVVRHVVAVRTSADHGHGHYSEQQGSSSPHEKASQANSWCAHDHARVRLRRGVGHFLQKKDAKEGEDWNDIVSHRVDRMSGCCVNLASWSL